MRFPGFSEPWIRQSLSELVERVTRKNTGLQSALPLTISAIYGLVDQQSFFNKIVAGENLAGYYLIKNGEFAYNKSSSSDYPWGAIKRLNNHSEGVLSTLYICFSPKSGICSDYLAQYCESNKWHNGISEIAQEGARNHGLLNVGVKDFFATKHNIPSSISEQEQIAKFLQLLDERIATQRRLIEDLEKLKSSINETLYATLTTDYQTSFSEIGCDYGGLTGKSAEDFGKGKPFITYLNVYQNQVITDCNFDYVEIRKDESQNKVRKGDLLFTLSSETPEEIGYSAVYMGDTKELYLNSFCFGIHISESEKVYPPYIGYFSSTSYFRRKIIPFAQGSTRFNLHKPSLMNMRFSLPTKENQITIFNTLQLLTDKILTETETLTRFIQQRSYMLSKMFI